MSEREKHIRSLGLPEPVVYLLGVIDTIRWDRKLLRDRCDKYENEMAEVCPEDYSLKETFKALQKEREGLRAEIARLRAALELYADANNWKCPRCGKRDSVNCFMGYWTGPVDGAPDPSPTGHGYDIARDSLQTSARGPESTAEAKAKPEPSRTKDGKPTTSLLPPAKEQQTYDLPDPFGLGGVKVKSE